MSIPDFQSIMLPLLEYLQDGKEHSNRELNQALADHFQLTQEEKEQLLPSGSQKVFTNRVAWAKAHMKMAGLLYVPKRGISVITERGVDVLRQKPGHIDLKLLKQFPEYQEKVGSGSSNRSESDSSAATADCDNRKLISL